jgi:hypothetical protein
MKEDSYDASYRLNPPLDTNARACVDQHQSYGFPNLFLKDIGGAIHPTPATNAMVSTVVFRGSVLNSTCSA